MMTAICIQDNSTSPPEEQGAYPILRFQEIYALDEPDEFPHSALALTLVFPISAVCEKQKVR